MNLSHLVTSFESDSSRGSSVTCEQLSPTARNKRSLLHDETPSVPVSNLCLDRSATNSTYTRTPQAPPSPPVEEQNKCSLPSISSLLEGADNLSHVASMRSLQVIQVAKVPPEALTGCLIERQRQNPPVLGEGEQPAQYHAANQTAVHPSRVTFPPTPPLRPGSGHDGLKQSPIDSSSKSVLSTTDGRRSNSATTPDMHRQRRISEESLQLQSGHLSRSRDSPTSTRETAFTFPPKSNTTPFVSPVEPPAPSAEFYRHPLHLPAFQSLPLTGAPVPHHHHHHMISLGNPAWQHHHYFPPSNATPYPQNHDRYICRTCHKAFSRPSSLRIHSHSHTGEKPFRCPHVGCGKAFSVRSNMKRHEKGCHTGRAGAVTLVN